MLAFMPWTARRALPPDSDAALVKRVRNSGDASALEYLYRRDAPAVYRYALARWRERAQPDEPEADEASHDLSLETLLVARQDLQALRDALARLPWAQREAVVLVDLQQRAYDEAAAIAGIELNTLRTRLHRGRIKLAALMQSDAGSPP